MSEMMEKVARAIFDFERITPRQPGWDKQIPEFHDHMRSKARAAIAAMREPTGAMMDSAIRGDLHWSMNALPRVKAAYQRAIDSALAEHQTPPGSRVGK